MKFAKVFFVLLLGYSQGVLAAQDNFKAQYVPPLEIRIFSNEEGNTQEEYIHCTPQTCCFSQRFWGFMDDGECICDLHLCEEWPTEAATKAYWMVIRGAEAERVCRPRELHKLTQLCLCDPYKNPPCDVCNPPVTAPQAPVSSAGCTSY